MDLVKEVGRIILHRCFILQTQEDRDKVDQAAKEIMGMVEKAIPKKYPCPEKELYAEAYMCGFNACRKLIHKNLGLAKEK